MMMSREEYEKETHVLDYQDYVKTYCPSCNNKDCPHRDNFRRLPMYAGGLGLCANLKGGKAENE